MASSSRLKPGEKGKVRLSIDIRGKLGTIYKTVGVNTNDPKTPKTTIAVRMTIKDPVHMKTYSASEIFSSGCKSCHVLQGTGKQGFDLFVTDCVMCHSAERIAPSQRDMRGKPREQIEKAIREGVKGTSMPGWDIKHGGPLKEEDIMSLIDYLKPPVKGNDGI
jgi:cytochrome c2